MVARSLPMAITQSGDSRNDVIFCQLCRIGLYAQCFGRANRWKTVVLVELSGANDALNMVAPVGNDRYSVYAHVLIAAGSAH